MASVGTIWANINLNIQNFASNMTRASSMMGRFAASTASASAAARSGFASYSETIAEATRDLNTHKAGLKDVSRIISGIVISQTFYTIANSIRDANRALWEFNEALDYAKVTYSALFNDSELGVGFLSILRDYAEQTIFSFEELTNTSKKLLAYGIPRENLMYITEGLTNLGSMSGDAAALDRIALALGQIYTRGKLGAEEMRQLANAYVPIYDIVKESFNLTGEQMGRVGDLNLPAADVINAVVDYANEQFGAVGDAAMLTITGLKQKITDSVKNLGVDIIAPMSAFYKSFLAFLSAQLQRVREAFDAGGVGGIFEYLVPDEGSQQRIRQFLANLSNLFAALGRAAVVAWQFASTLFRAFADTFNVISPVITTLINLLSGLGHMIAENTTVTKILAGALAIAATMWVVFKLRALGAMVVAALSKVILGVASAVLFLSKVLAANPFVLLIIAIGAGLAVAAASANNANNAISNLFNNLSSYSGGKGAEDILQLNDSFDKATGDIEEYNKRMEGAADSMEELGDKASGAGKKAGKGLLSFDEVYKLNDNASDAGTGSLGNIENLLDDIGSLGAGLGDLLEIPDFKDYTDKFVNGLFGSLWESIKTIAGGAGHGGLTGALIGFAIGGLVTRTIQGALAGAKLGATIGSIAGAGFAGFWTETYEQMEGTLSNIAAGAGVGALVGGLVGFVVGAFVSKSVAGAMEVAKWGAGIGAILGSGIGGFWSMATEEMNNSLENILVGGSAGALVGGLVGMVIGAFAGKAGNRLSSALYGATLGSTIGGLVGGGLGTFWAVATQEMEGAIENALVGGAAGAFAGGLAGMVIGAIASAPGARLKGALTGAKWGAAIGSLVGGGISAFWTTASDDMKSKIESVFVGAAEGALVGGLAGMVIGAFVTRTVGGAAAGAKWGAALGGLIGGGIAPVFDEAETAMTDKLNNLFSGISAASMGAFAGGLVGMAVGAVIGAFAGGVGALPGARLGGTIGAAAGGLIGMLINKLMELNVGQVIADWFEGIGDWLTEKAGAVKEWFIDEGNWKGITLLIVNPVWGALKLLYDNNDEFKKWADDLGNKIKDAFTAVKEWFIDEENWKGVALLIVSPVFGALKLLYDNNDEFKKWVDDLKTKVSTGFENIKQEINTWSENTQKNFEDWKEATKTKIETWSTETKQEYELWKEETKKKFDTWKTDTVKKITDWATNATKEIGTWIFGSEEEFDGWKENVKNTFDDWKEETIEKVRGWIEDTLKKFTTWRTDVKKAWEKIWDPDFWSDAWDLVSDWFSDLWTDISDWFTSMGKSISSWWNGLWSDKKANVSVDGNVSYSGGTSKPLTGHALGGIFTREHVARFAEGNKAEMVVPLENSSAMQPFVNAISNGIVEGIAPSLLSASGRGNNLPPLYVGTLIADERGLKELYKKFEVYEAKELARKGLA